MLTEYCYGKISSSEETSSPVNANGRYFQILILGNGVSGTAFTAALRRAIVKSNLVSILYCFSSLKFDANAE